MSGRPGDIAAGPESGMALPYVAQIIHLQHAIHDALTQRIEALKEGKSLAALWGLLLLGFAYGVFHVLAPGHSKTIVASYFLGNRARWMDGIWAGLVMAIGHTVTAVGFVVALNLLLGLTQFGVLDKVRYGELFGYGLITLIGGWLLWRSLEKAPGGHACGCGHDHGGHAHHEHHRHDHADHHHDHVPVHGLWRNKRALGLFAATSLVPCTGSMIILLFTLANDVLWAGVLAVIAIALGMWLTVTVIGTAAILMRRMILREGGDPPRWRRVLLRVLNVAAALIVLVTGGLLFAGTFYGMAG